MADVWFCSDLHFGHKKIGEYREHVFDEEENRYLIMRDWKEHVTKRGVVFVLGDAAFTMDTVQCFGELPGRKILIRGNHDLLDTQVYLKYFESVYGLFRYKEFWLSHAPIHPDELRGKVNLHGHVHYHTVLDNRYFNCCVENMYQLKKRSIMSLDEIRKELGER